jgi:hypothetical protein
VHDYQKVIDFNDKRTFTILGSPKFELVPMTFFSDFVQKITYITSYANNVWNFALVNSWVIKEIKQVSQVTGKLYGTHESSP